MRGVELTDPRDPQWPTRASNLSGLLRVRFDEIGNLNDVEQSIALSQAAAEATPDGDPGRGLRWSNLSNGLAARYDLRRDPRDLDAAVGAGRRAMEAAPPRHPARGPIITNIANLLLTRFEQFGELADIDESIRLGNEALRSARVNGPARAGLQSNLGNAYRSRYELRSDPGDLRNALTMTRAAVQSTGLDDPALASRLSNQAMTLLTEYERANAASVLDEAVQAGREAVAAAGPRPERLSKLLSNLSILLARRGEASASAQQERDVAEAVTTCESAVAVLSPDSPHRAIRLVNLAGTLLAYAKLSSDADAARRRITAIDCYRQAAAVETAAVPVRVQAARGQGDLAARLGAWPAALNGYAQAVSMLGRLVPRSITRRSREQFLIRASGLAANSAASALEAGDPDKAVELLEQGRAVLWAQALEQSLAADLAASHPAIAARLEEIATVLG
jgi:tetratricopeptide (TPR) repeat protein